MKAILILLSFFFVCASYGQGRTPIPWGVWGYGGLDKASALDKYAPYDIRGYHLNIRWSELEPEKNVFNWSLIDEKVNTLVSRHLWTGLLVLVGQNSPEWIYNKVPRVVTSGHEDTGPYPYYFDPDYVAAYLNLLKQVALHIAGYSDDVKKYIIYWQIAEGSTGDAQPYKGEPLNAAYDISKSQWTDFRRATWDSVNAYAERGEGITSYKFLFNAGNDGKDLEYVEARFPRNMNKDGNLSHLYSFDGEGAYFARQLRHIHDVLFNYRNRGEAHQFWNESWWQEAPLKQTFILVCSAITGGLDMLDLPFDWFNENTSDPRPTDFFNKYAIRSAENSSTGFVVFRDVIDFTDTMRFPRSVYGPVIDPLRRKDFERRIKNINSDPQDSAIFKYWQKITAVRQYLNPERVNNLVNKYKDLGALYNTAGDQYHNDFGVGMDFNYHKFVHQMDANARSEGVYRIGPDTSMYGRYGRKFLIKDGKGEMFFNANDSLFNMPSGPTFSDTVKYKVQISVVYYDTANGQWAITNGPDKLFQFKNKGTRQWKRVTVQFDSFVLFRGKHRFGGVDFTLRYLGGANTPFALVELDNLDKGPHCPEYESIITPPGPVTLCEGDSVILAALSGMATYAWNTGDTTSGIIVKAAGNYAVTITDSSGCIAGSDSVKVIVNPAPHTTITVSGAISKLCPGKTVNLTSSAAYKYYLWSNDSTRQSIKVTGPGDYWVTVTDKNGCMNNSDTVTVTYEPCARPTNPFTNSIKVDMATLNWTQADTCAVGYQVQYRKAGTQNWTTEQLANTNKKQISSLKPGTKYEWVVQTICKSDLSIVSGYINGLDFITLSCVTPTDLLVDNIKSDLATLNWTQASGDAIKYQIRYRKVGSQNWTTEQLGNTNKKQISSLKPGTKYEWGVQTICKSDLSIVSGYIKGPNFTTLSCKKPTDLFINNIKPDKATLNWTQASKGAINYQIQYREAGTQNWTTQQLANTNIKQITSLKPGTKYEWGVQTVCKSDLSIVSGYSKGPNFTTALSLIVQADIVKPRSIITSTKLNVVLYPNPTSGSALLGISGEAGSVNIAITDYTGKIMWQKINTNEKQVNLSVGKFAAGVYMVIVMSRSEKKVIKFVKQ